MPARPNFTEIQPAQNIPRFGEEKSGEIYRERARAAAVIFHDGKVAVLEVEKPKGLVYLLPGGGIEPGESAETAALRETEEEAGLRVGNPRFLGENEFFDPYFSKKDDVFLRLKTQFFVVDLLDQKGEKIENDRRLLWLDPIEAREKLRAHEAWAVR